MVICPICNKEMNYINNSHLKTHDLTPASFKEKFPNYKNISDLSLQGMSNTDKTNGNLANKKRGEKNLVLKKEHFFTVDKKCKQCNNSIPYNDTNNKFCSHSCSAIFTNLSRNVIYSEKGMKNLRESGLKTSVDNFKNRRQTYINKIFRLQCKICKNDFNVDYKKKLHTTCSSECRSKAHAIFNFKQNKTYAKSGYYQRIYCASSWELAFLIFNKHLGNIIRRCEKYFTYEINEKNIYIFQIL